MLITGVVQVELILGRVRGEGFVIVVTGCSSTIETNSVMWMEVCALHLRISCMD